MVSRGQYKRYQDSSPGESGLGTAVGEKSSWRKSRIGNVSDKSPHTAIGVFVYDLWFRAIGRVDYPLRWRRCKIAVMQA